MHALCPKTEVCTLNDLETYNQINILPQIDPTTHPPFPLMPAHKGLKQLAETTALKEIRDDMYKRRMEDAVANYLLFKDDCDNMPHFITIRRSPSTRPAPSRSFYTLVTIPDYDPNSIRTHATAAPNVPTRARVLSGSRRTSHARMTKTRGHGPYARHVCII